MGLTGEKGYHSVDSCARYHFIIGLIIELHDKTVQMNITKGHYYQALAPLPQYVLDALGFQQGKGPVFSYEDKEVVTLHSQPAAHVVDTLLGLQQAMSASKLRPTWRCAHIPCEATLLVVSKQSIFKQGRF